jgi:hypothetical protein
MPSIHAFALSELGSVLHTGRRTEEGPRAMTDAISLYEAKGDRTSAARAQRLLRTMDDGAPFSG